MNPHLTAIQRTKPSAPAHFVFPICTEYKISTILDFGCGYGKDVTFYNSLGYNALGYDPVYNPIPLPDYIDLSTCFYVLNVIPEKESRKQLIDNLICRSSYIFLVTRSKKSIEKEAQMRGWQKLNDGYISSKNKQTFQKGFTTEELMELLPLDKIEVLDISIKIKDATYVFLRVK